MEIDSMEKLQDMMKFMRRGGQTDDPSINYLSFIPQTLRSDVLVMSSRQLKMDKMVTLFVGTIRANYTDYMWKEDVAQWKKHFGPDQEYYEVDLLPMRQASSGPAIDQMNGRDAIPKIETALQALNSKKSGQRIRIICLGTGYSHFLYEAITFLLKEWKQEKESTKYLQFVTSGDTGGNDLCSFCRWLCVSKVVDEIEFYNTNEYHPFGYCAATYK